MLSQSIRPSPHFATQITPRDRQQRPLRTIGRGSLIGILALSIAVLTSGCAAVVVGGAAVGASAMYDRRHHQVFLEDEEIELRALHAIEWDSELKGRSGITATSYNRSVLLTGQANSEDIAKRATDLVSRIPKVQRIIDEISVGPRISFARESEDAYITSRAKLALTKISRADFNPTRVKVVTENGVVYLMGLVSPEEADEATEAVRYVSGVERVVKLFEYK